MHITTYFAFMSESVMSFVYRIVNELQNFANKYTLIRLIGLVTASLDSDADLYPHGLQ